jgi:hypothetical protein
MHCNKITTMNAFITKWALASGIVESEVEVDESCPSYISWGRDGFGNDSSAYGEGKQWHRTRQQAVEHANSMRDKRIISLMKQIEKLRKLKF